MGCGGAGAWGTGVRGHGVEGCGLEVRGHGVQGCGGMGCGGMGYRLRSRGRIPRDLRAPFNMSWSDAALVLLHLDSTPSCFERHVCGEENRNDHMTFASPNPCTQRLGRVHTSATHTSQSLGPVQTTKKELLASLTITAD